MIRIHRAIGIGALCLAGLAGMVARASDPNYEYFFIANNDSYKAYLDHNNQSTDAARYRLVNVKISTFSDTFRTWIKKNFPGAETADYALDPYSIDCSGKMVGEHRLVFYDSNGFPMADYDFGGHMAPPIGGTMKDELMKKVCGF